MFFDDTTKKGKIPFAFNTVDNEKVDVLHHGPNRHLSVIDKLCI